MCNVMYVFPRLLASAQQLSQKYIKIKINQKRRVVRKQKVLGESGIFRLKGHPRTGFWVLGITLHIFLFHLSLLSCFQVALVFGIPFLTVPK